MYEDIRIGLVLAAALLFIMWIAFLYGKRFWYHYFLWGLIILTIIPMGIPKDLTDVIVICSLVLVAGGHLYYLKTGEKIFRKVQNRFPDKWLDYGLEGEEAAPFINSNEHQEIINDLKSGVLGDELKKDYARYETKTKYWAVSMGILALFFFIMAFFT